MKILKFYTPTCMPCKAIGKLLERVEVPVEEINALEDIAAVDKYNVCTTPTLIFLNEKDEEVGRTIGMVTLSTIKEIIGKNNR
jgi:thiol-disulfide isomerase/thioredoxin